LDASAFRSEAVAGQTEGTTPAIPVTGIAVGDALLEVLVFDTGVPSVRALADFTIQAGQITAVDNIADNNGNTYLVRWLDKTP
jgi:hypothetical protein